MAEIRPHESWQSIQIYTSTWSRQPKYLPAALSKATRTFVFLIQLALNEPINHHKPALFITMQTLQTNGIHYNTEHQTLEHHFHFHFLFSIRVSFLPPLPPSTISEWLIDKRMVLLGSFYGLLSCSSLVCVLCVT